MMTRELDPRAHADALADYADYRVLRRLRSVTGFHRPRPDVPTRIGVVVDVETTGLDRDSAVIIELAAQRFRFDPDGRIVQVGQPRVWREDPGIPIDPVITRLTGLTNDKVAGQRIDDAEAVALLSSADVIVAHNAAFDRPFIDRRLPAQADQPWACSLAEPDWLELGFDGRALAHLVSQCGWFYEGHRAENDILALLYLLATTTPDGDTVLKKLLACSDRIGFRVEATGAPFEAKDALKTRGYRWDATKRCWWTEIAEDAVDTERGWLGTSVYAGRGEAAFTRITARERYRA